MRLNSNLTARLDGRSGSRMAEADGSRRTAWLRHARLTWLQANGSTKARAAAAHTTVGTGSSEDTGRVQFAERVRGSGFDPWRRVRVEF
ncbi:hypothetical protein E5676_scaffold92G00030 [Cucumis melo var. makuwa]|uniref:Uncharacterized protein n=1 Tax=Cucumis melo var. makuwa TaxID=1194695 RepID=A0A5D3BBK5_CUCMM|nr:hypothetical protein E5676_scaffold92G00030 [Cucumis melo var. makuwa]